MQHRASLSASFNASPEEVWEAISDFQSSPEWRSAVQSVEAIEGPGLSQAWREVGRFGDPIEFELIETVLYQKLVRRIISPHLPIGGQWTYLIEPSGSGTRLTIVKDSEVYSPFFRLSSTFLIGHTSSLKLYLAELKTRLESPDSSAI